MRKTDLTDRALCLAVDEMERGLIDAELGGGLVKKRVALPGRGKSGSTRTIVATNKGDRWLFIYGFEKNERENINFAELKILKFQAEDFLRMTAEQLSTKADENTITEICHDRQKKQDSGRGASNGQEL